MSPRKDPNIIGRVSWQQRKRTGGGCLGEGTWGRRGCVNRRLSKVRQKVRLGAGPPTHTPQEKEGVASRGQACNHQPRPSWRSVWDRGSFIRWSRPLHSPIQRIQRNQRNIKHLLSARHGSPYPNPNSSTSKLGDLGQEAATLCASVSSGVMTVARGLGLF